MDEPDGFAAFAAARYPALLRLTFALTQNRQSAEDLAQTALMRLWPRWNRVSAEGDPWPYLRRIALSSHASWWRKWNLGPHTVPEDADIAADGDAFADADVRAAIKGWLARLPARQRAVLIARYLMDMSVEETAEALGCSTGTVKSQTSKALQHLRTARVLDAGQQEEDAPWTST